MRKKKFFIFHSPFRNSVFFKRIFSCFQLWKIITGFFRSYIFRNMWTDRLHEKKRINKRKKLIEKGLDPEEADREIEADIDWKRRKGDKSSKTRKRKGAHNLKFKVRVRLFSMFDICTPYNWEKMNLFCRIWLAKWIFGPFGVSFPLGQKVWFLLSTVPTDIGWRKLGKNCTGLSTTVKWEMLSSSFFQTNKTSHWVSNYTFFECFCLLLTTLFIVCMYVY